MYNIIYFSFRKILIGTSMCTWQVHQIGEDNVSDLIASRAQTAYSRFIVAVTQGFFLCVTLRDVF